MLSLLCFYDMKQTLSKFALSFCLPSALEGRDDGSPFLTLQHRKAALESYIIGASAVAEILAKMDNQGLKDQFCDINGISPQTPLCCSKTHVYRTNVRVVSIFSSDSQHKSNYANYPPKTKEYRATMMNGFVGAEPSGCGSNNREILFPLTPDLTCKRSSAGSCRQVSSFPHDTAIMVPSGWHISLNKMYGCFVSMNQHCPLLLLKALHFCFPTLC
ncbi:hypothetical protein L3Q82_004910 [Scortum barcoo]|uniref:Uncharacterized protein n=1 Tax=Scortum barcoo TaxID=214431 RepID=A0ACB8VDV8_9TELE|nr:hypothetical protein L3Q82_004910 [Scortum barcoo]